MKSNEFFRLLINPFTRIAGWQAFGLGLVFIVLMGLLGTNNGVAFDGVIDMHLTNLTLLQSFTYLAIDVLSLVLVMCVVGLISSKHFRFIDVLGTMTLAKAPFLILAIAGFFTTTPDMTQAMKNPYALFQDLSFLFILVLSLPVIVWSITLMLNALKTSCDLKGSKLTIAFIIGLFVSEMLAKIAIYTCV